MNRKVNLVVDKIFDVFPTTFRLDRDRCQNRTSKEHPELRTPEGQPTSWFHLLPGTYSISFRDSVTVAPGEVVSVKTSRELIRNGMFLVSQEFGEGYNGVIELNLHVTVAPFEFHKDSILGTLEIQSKVQHAPLGLNDVWASADFTKFTAAQPPDPNLTIVTTVGTVLPNYTGFPIHNNPFLDSVAKFEQLDKTLNFPPEPTPKKTNVLKGRKWAYLEVDGEITHKLRIAPEEIEEYVEKGYVLGFPPSMNHKGE